MSNLNDAPDGDQDGGEAASEFVEELILGLERAADGESDPEIKSRLRGAAAILSTVGRHVTTEIAAKIIERAMDL
ncbi:MAG: hypothetical protein ACRDVE_12495 [Actinocrinis sp.]